MKQFTIQYIAVAFLLLLAGAGCSFSFNTKPEEKVASTSVSLSGEALKAKIECENLKGTVETYITDINIPNEQRVFCKFQDGSSCEQIDINDGFCKQQRQTQFLYTLPINYKVIDNNTFVANATNTGKLILAVEKDEAGRYGKIELFRMSDFGERPFGFEGDETEQDILRYIPVEQTKVEINGATYDIWLYYKKGDTHTKAELDSIVKSLKWK